MPAPRSPVAGAYRIPRPGTLSARIYDLRMQGVAYRQIADALGTTEDTARVLMYKLKRKIGRTQP